jgi:hypothetical protein
MGKKKLIPTNSFQDTVNKAVNQRLINDINQELNIRFQSFDNKLTRVLDNLFTRLTGLEELVKKKFSISEDRKSVV